MGAITGNHTVSQGQAAPAQGARLSGFDVIRGFSVISMVLFHLCYDLRFIAGFPLGFFRPPLQDIWRASISWVFLFVAGCMCSLSRNGLKRSLRYLGAALAIYIVTSLASVDTPISFGIIFCMGACTLIEWVLSRLGLSPRGPWAALGLFMAFVVLLHVPQGYLGTGPLTVALPSWLYSHRALSFLGFPGPSFASGDYYPVIPFVLMYLTGTAMGRHWHSEGYPRWAYHGEGTPLAWVGRHALEIYLLHQPVLLLLVSLVS